MKEVPNLTFSKTNFTGYNIQIRGIGTQAISVTTDPAVAVAFNDTPFIRNHFFEQEFYDVTQVEVLRGPQGTLYGRNATAGVVNVISAKPTDQFEAMLSADIGNYHNRRYEGMINIPIVDDRLDLRVAGEWTKRDGYTFNEIDRHAYRWPRSVVEPRDARAGSQSKMCRPISSGNIFRKTTTACAPASSFARRIPRPPKWAAFRSLAIGVTAWLYDARFISARAACQSSLYDKGDPAMAITARSAYRMASSLPYCFCGIRWRSTCSASVRSLCQHDAIARICAIIQSAINPDIPRQERYAGIQRRL